MQEGLDGRERLGGQDGMKIRFWLISGLLTVGAIVHAQSPARRAPRVDTTDPACQAATLVSTGGAFPSNASTLAIRWTGYSNFELAYKGQILLLDAYFDRGSVYPPLGFKAADIKRANAILIGRRIVEQRLLHVADSRVGEVDDPVQRHTVDADPPL